MESDDLHTRIGKVLHAKYGSSSIMGDDPNWDDVHPATQKKWRKDAEALIRELNTNCVGYQVWNAAEWISINSGCVPYEIHRNADGTGGGWRVTVQRIEAADE